MRPVALRVCKRDMRQETANWVYLNGSGQHFSAASNGRTIWARASRCAKAEDLLSAVFPDQLGHHVPVLLR